MKKKNQELDKLVGYSIPACLWEKDPDSSNQEEKVFFDAINNITKICQYHLQNEYQILI